MTSGVICQYRDKSFRVRVRRDADWFLVETYNPIKRVYECAATSAFVDSALSLFTKRVREYLARL